MKRRGMATVLAGTMVLSMLGGFAVQADEESYDPITIQFWNGWTGSDGQVLMEYVDKFNETNKWNITVEMDMSSEFRDKITTAMAADAAPALILGNAADKYTYDGKLRKLDEIWDNTDIKKEFAGCHVYSKPSCRDCWAKFYCSGGCNANNYIYNGDIHDAYELSCKIMRKRLECAILSQVRDMLK